MITRRILITVIIIFLILLSIIAVNISGHRNGSEPREKLQSYSLERLGDGRAEGEHFREPWPGVDPHALPLQRLTYAGEQVRVLEDLLMNEQRLHGVAGGRIVALGVANCRRGRVGKLGKGTS